MGNLAADLTKLLENFSLSEEEIVGVEVQVESLEEVVTQGKSCLVGKLLANRMVSKEIIKSTLVRCWKITGPCSFKVIGANLFIIEFQNVWDKSSVLDGRPWIFEGQLFAVEEFNGLTPPTQISFAQAAFWVRMYNLPLACMSTDIGLKIGSSVGVVEDVDVVDDGVGWGEFLRVRICLDLSKPLARGRMLKLRGDSVWVAFQYEKLPKFCFRCGVIRQGAQGCLQNGGQRSSGEVAEPQFGSWLRALSPNRRQGNGRWDASGGPAAAHPLHGEPEVARSRFGGEKRYAANEQGQAHVSGVSPPVAARSLAAGVHGMTDGENQKGKCGSFDGSKWREDSLGLAEGANKEAFSPAGKSYNAPLKEGLSIT